MKIQKWIFFITLFYVVESAAIFNQSMVRNSLLRALYRYHTDSMYLFTEAPDNAYCFSENTTGLSKLLPFIIQFYACSEYLDFKSLLCLSRVNRELNELVKTIVIEGLFRFNPHLLTEIPSLNYMLFRVIHDNFKDSKDLKSLNIHDNLALATLKLFVSDFEGLPKTCFFYIICFLHELVYGPYVFVSFKASGYLIDVLRRSRTFDLPKTFEFLASAARSGFKFDFLRSESEDNEAIEVDDPFINVDEENTANELIESFELFRKRATKEEIKFHFCRYSNIEQDFNFWDDIFNDSVDTAFAIVIAETFFVELSQNNAILGLITKKICDLGIFSAPIFDRYALVCQQEEFNVMMDSSFEAAFYFSNRKDYYPHSHFIDERSLHIFTKNAVRPFSIEKYASTHNSNAAETHLDLIITGDSTSLAVLYIFSELIRSRLCGTNQLSYFLKLTGQVDNAVCFEILIEERHCPLSIFYLRKDAILTLSPSEFSVLLIRFLVDLFGFRQHDDTCMTFPVWSSEKYSDDLDAINSASFAKTFMKALIKTDNPLIFLTMSLDSLKLLSPYIRDRFNLNKRYKFLLSSEDLAKFPMTGEYLKSRRGCILSFKQIINACIPKEGGLTEIFTSNPKVFDHNDGAANDNIVVSVGNIIMYDYFTISPNQFEQLFDIIRHSGFTYIVIIVLIFSYKMMIVN